MSKRSVLGTVFDVQRFSIHDGPGIRTTVFLKGCPASCRWCQNPESRKPQPELFHTPDRCIRCGACIEICDRDALSRNGTGDLQIDRRKCDLCGECLAVCHALALEKVGREVTVETLLGEVLRDRPFYETSGGGVTLSGGEPTAQSRFSTAFLKACKRERLHTCVDTFGYCEWKTLERMAPYVDLFLYDVKHVDPAKHRAITGLPNRRILNNLRRLAALSASIVVRVPIVPEQNDTEAEVLAICDFVKSLDGGVEGISLLGYHTLAKSKFERLGEPYALDLLEPLPRERLDAFKELCAKQGLEVIQDY